MWLGNLLPRETHCGCLTSAHQRFWLATKLLQSCLVSPLEATEQPPTLPPKMPTRKVIRWSYSICLWRIKYPPKEGREWESMEPRKVEAILEKGWVTHLFVTPTSIVAINWRDLREIIIFLLWLAFWSSFGNLLGLKNDCSAALCLSLSSYWNNVFGKDDYFWNFFARVSY